MRIGLLGPADGHEDALRDAIEFVLGDVSVDEALYLGREPAVLAKVLGEYAQAICGGEATEEAFLARAAELAMHGTPAQIEALLTAEATIARLTTIRALPPPPARAVELVADRILIAVHDKSVLDEEDIANAQLIVYGNASEALLRRFGPRYFLTPGPVRDGRVAILEVEDDGQVSIALFETSGLPVWREKMARRSTKVNVVT